MLVLEMASVPEIVPPTPPISFSPPLKEVPFFRLPTFVHGGGLLPLALFAIGSKSFKPSPVKGHK